MKCPTCGQAMLTEWPHDHGPVSERKAASGHVEAGALSDYQRGYVDGFDAPANVTARAAIRTEARSAGELDVERFETAWRNVEVEDDRVGIIGRGRFIDRIAAEYARLAEDAE